MNSIFFKSHLGEYIKNYIKLKQAIGYKYCANAERLKRFDAFMLKKYPKAILLTKEIVLDWCSKKSYEKRGTQCLRASSMRQFGLYLNSIGIRAYIIPKGYYSIREKYTPYIYTVHELKRFFSAADQCQYCCRRPHRHLSIPVIFRMIYMCGLRVSEARLLKVSDVDLENGILTIQHSKNDCSRLVPMSASLTEHCRQFSKKVHFYSKAEDYYFPNQINKPMTNSSIYYSFRKFLCFAKISHRGRGYGPRVHDFRYPNINKIQTFFTYH